MTVAGETLPPAAGHKAQLLDALYTDPQYRPQLLEMVKGKFPGVRIPEVDVREDIRAATTPLNEQINKLQGAILERDVRDRERETRQKHGIRSDEEWKSVTELAAQRGIADMDTAAEFHRLSNRAVEPRYAPTPILLPNMKELWQNPTKYARDEAYKVMNEFAAARSRGGVG